MVTFVLEALVMCNTYAILATWPHWFVFSAFFALSSVAKCKKVPYKMSKIDSQEVIREKQETKLQAVEYVWQR